MKKIRVLVVGQIPPPYHGQSMMIQNLVNAKFESVEITHLRMDFSKETSQIGRFGWRKLFHLFSVLVKGIQLIFSRHIELIYYPPGGQTLVPVLRDIVLLSGWRVFRKKVVFHFHTSGLSEFLQRAKWPLRVASKIAFGKPDAVIALSQFNPKDGEFFGAKKIFVVPNGLPDPVVITRTNNAGRISILYVGMLIEEKGLYDLAEAFRILRSESIDAVLHLAGEFDNESNRKRFLNAISENCIRGEVVLHDFLRDERKWQLYSEADMLCFLSFHPGETFGNVVLEAMICGLPVVATKWRGVQDLVIDGENGFLVPLHDAQAAAAKLKLLSQDANLRKQFGARGRERYLQHFTLQKHLAQMERVFVETASAISLSGSL